MPLKNEMEMKTIEYKEMLSKLEYSDFSSIQALNSGGIPVLTTANAIMYRNGINIIRDFNLYSGKWYRIGKARNGNINAVALLLAKTRYDYASPSSQLFYIALNSWSESVIVQLAKQSTAVFKNIRLLYAKDGNKNSEMLLEVKSSLYGPSNMLNLSFMSAIDFEILTPLEVPEEPLTGFSVKEFVF